MWKRSSAAVAVAIALTAWAARSQVDPSRTLRIYTGSAPLLFEFPARPNVIWQVRAPEALAGVPARDSGGRLVVAGIGGHVSLLDARGRASWTVRAGTSIVGGPWLSSNGRLLVLTADAELIALSPKGRPESRTRLPWREIDATAIAVPTSDGGMLVAAGARFARLGPFADLAATGTTREPLRGVFEWRGLSLLVERSGQVLALASAGEAVELATFGRPIRRVALAGDRLFGLVADDELAELDLVRRQSKTRWTDPAVTLRELAVLPSAEVRLLASGGSILAADSNGRELFRSATQFAPGADGPSALVVDGGGAAIAAVAGFDLTFVTKAGDILKLPATACSDPLPPTPLAPGLVVAACRSGLLFGISDKAR